jgi:hypothetical protein
MGSSHVHATCRPLISTDRRAEWRPRAVPTIEISDRDLEGTKHHIQDMKRQLMVAASVLTARKETTMSRLKCVRLHHVFKPVLQLFMAVSVCSLPGGPAHADPVDVGGKLYAAGYAVRVQVLHADAGYTSELWRVYPGPPQFIATSKDDGRIVYVSTLPNQEVVFAIYVRDTGDRFYTGPGSRNIDGMPHAVVDWQTPRISNLGFEDLMGGGDQDYNDAMFQIVGVYR